MKKKLVLFALWVITTHSAFSQKVEIGLNVGLANYAGDLAPSIVLSETQPSAGAFARLNLNNTWALTGFANLLRVSGRDANFSFNAPRNLSFRTDIAEFAAVFEYNYFKYGTGVRDVHFTPYIYWGLGAAFYNPKAYYNGEWNELRPYQTEGSANAYSGVTAIMPLGIGLKWMPSKKMSFEWSIGGRKTYTDYLDDVSKTYIDANKQAQERGLIAAVLTDPSSLKNEGVFVNKSGYQRGNPDFKDWYFNTNICISYRIFTRIKCARFY